jgi:hypothetical protein
MEHRRGRGRLSHGIEREVRRIEQSLPFDDHGLLHDRLKLAHVPGPRVRHQTRHRRRGDTVDREPVPRVGLATQVLDQQREVLPALPERRHLEDDSPKSIIEVLPEGALARSGAEVAVGGGEDPDVGMDHPRRANGPDLARGEEPEEHRLGLGDQLADLIQENGPAVDVPKEPGPPLDGPREGAPLVAEELTQEELACERAAVDCLEPRAAASAQPVEGGRDELLSRTGLAKDEAGHVVRGHAPDPVEECPHRSALADEPMKGRQGFHWQGFRPTVTAASWRSRPGPAREPAEGKQGETSETDGEIRIWVLEGLEHVAQAAGRVQVNLMVSGPDRFAGRALGRARSTCVARDRGEEPEQKTEERLREEHPDDVTSPHRGPAWLEGTHGRGRAVTRSPEI